MDGCGHTVFPVLTGVIYGAIVVVWAAYLVPLALRRHDEASRTRSVERFSSSMRVLGRRESADAEPTVGAAEVEQGPEPRRTLVTPVRNAAAERSAAARRRKILLGLAVLTLLVAIAAMVGKVPPWGIGVPVLLIAGFLVTARITVRRQRQPYWVEEPADIGESGASSASIATGDEDDDSDDEPTIGLSAAARRVAAGSTAIGGPPVEFMPPEPIAEATPMRATTGTLWEPVPVTLPTYVGAPVAARSIRTIDLSGPGVWSSGHSDEATQAIQAAEAAGAAGAAAQRGDKADGNDEGDDVARAVNA